MQRSITTAVAVLSLAAASFGQSENLRASSVSSQTKDLRIGQRMTIHSTVRNAGLGSVPASRAGYFLSTNTLITTADKLISSYAVPALGTGRSYSHVFSWRIAGYIPRGTAHIGLYVDYQKKIKEANETDNTTSFPVTSHGRPDVLVTRIGAKPEISVGEPQTLSIEVRNNGGVSTGRTCKLYMFLSQDERFNVGDELVGQSTVPVMPPLSVRNVPTTFTVPTRVTLGKWFLIAYVDPTRSIPGEFSSNNQTRVTTTVYRKGVAKPFGVACTGSNGRPRHDIVGVQDGPMVGRGVTFRMTSGPRSGASLLSVGLSRTRLGALPLPLRLDAFGATGCWLYQSMEILLGATTTANGLATRTLRIPAVPAFIGGRLYSQFIGVDRIANRAGLSFSNGVDTTLGGRASQ